MGRLPDVDLRQGLEAGRIDHQDPVRAGVDAHQQNISIGRAGDMLGTLADLPRRHDLSDSRVDNGKRGSAPVRDNHMAAICGRCDAVRPLAHPDAYDRLVVLGVDKGHHVVDVVRGIELLAVGPKGQMPHDRTRGHADGIDHPVPVGVDDGDRRAHAERVEQAAIGCKREVERRILCRNPRNDLVP